MSIVSKLKELFAPSSGNGSVWLQDSGGVFFDEVLRLMSQSPAELYRSQPHLQTVINFRARNVAQLGLHVYERVSDTDRRRVKGTPLDSLLARPNNSQTLYELMRGLVCDLDLYGAAYWLMVPDADTASGWQILPVSPTWVAEFKGGSIWLPEQLRLCPGNGREQWFDVQDFIIFRGWNPTGGLGAVSPIEALKNVLSEQIAAWEFRQQMWQRGGRLGAYIARPKDAPEWNEEARARFLTDWRQFQASGMKAGSTPVFEDGMELKRVGFSAREEEWVEATKLSLQTVASVYHVNPVMIGATEGASYASTREFRSMLYTETLGPLLAMVEARLNQFLVPRIVPKPGIYVEFNIDAKLSGNFEEQAGILSTATGAPWMTVNEARAKRNLPALEGADELVVPLNVTAGGQASPQDGGTPPVAVENAREEGETGE